MLPPSFNDYSKLNKDVHKYNTRLSSNIHKTQTRTNYQKHSVKYKGNLIWDNLPKSFKEIRTIGLFKKTVKTHFLLQQKEENINH